MIDEGCTSMKGQRRVDEGTQLGATVERWMVILDSGCLPPSIACVMCATMWQGLHEAATCGGVSACARRGEAVKEHNNDKGEAAYWVR
jgi:hypothetical protein